MSWSGSTGSGRASSDARLHRVDEAGDVTNDPRFVAGIFQRRDGIERDGHQPGRGMAQLGRAAARPASGIGRGQVLDTRKKPLAGRGGDAAGEVAAVGAFGEQHVARLQGLDGVEHAGGALFRAIVGEQVGSCLYEAVGSGGGEVVVASWSGVRTTTAPPPASARMRPAAMSWRSCGCEFAARLVGDDEDEEGGVFDDPDGGTGGDAFANLGLGECGAAPVEAAAGSDLDAGSGAFGAGVAAAAVGGRWGGSAARDAAAGLGRCGQGQRLGPGIAPAAGHFGDSVAARTSSAISATCGPGADDAFQHQGAVRAGDGDGRGAGFAGVVHADIGDAALAGHVGQGAPPPPPQQLERMPERSISTRSTPMASSRARGASISPL